MNPTSFKWLLHGLGLAATGVVVALALGLVIRPMQVESEQLHRDVQRKSDFLTAADAIEARNRELKGKLADTENLLVEIKRRIPDSAQEADFLAQLAAAAREARVEIVDYRPATAIEKESHSRLAIQVSATGGYAAICRFLDRLEGLPRLCHITGMGIDSADPAARGYKLDLTLQVFFSPARPDVAKKVENGNG